MSSQHLLNVLMMFALFPVEAKNYAWKRGIADRPGLVRCPSPEAGHPNSLEWGGVVPQRKPGCTWQRDVGQRETAGSGTTREERLFLWFSWETECEDQSWVRALLCPQHPAQHVARNKGTVSVT